MAKKIKGKHWKICGLLFFAAYFFAAARPIQEETILVPRWVTAYEDGTLATLGNFAAAQSGETLVPFRIEQSRYGYIRHDGNFALNRIAQGNFDLSQDFWAEHASNPPHIQVMNPQSQSVLTIEKPRGFPLFLDGRIFLVGGGQNSLTAIGSDGQELWQHDFRAPLTSIAAAAGRIIAGTIDGSVELLNSQGKLVIPPFEPGGSRLQAIYGVDISGDGHRIAVISGIDSQRFLLLEQTGDIFRVIHHEFLGSGFRRSVYVSFADNDRHVVFEREGGIGIYDITARAGTTLPLPGEIRALDTNGESPYLFVVTSPTPDSKRFIAIRYPGAVVIDTPFDSNAAFFSRRGNRVFLGSDSVMAAFELRKR
ncbi:MAG: WD40 repeat domain-containing protein [Treponema sp.]|nr:WD40 repeat domain-containing protein [Treponema sp.]